MRHLIFLLLLVAYAMPIPAAVTLSKEQDHYLLENAFVRLRVIPSHGGMVDSFVVKSTGRELLGEGMTMLIDHFWQQRWPGEFMNAPYEARVITDTPEAVTLEVSRVSQGEGPNVTQAGIRIRRRMTLRANSPQLLIEVAMENTSPTGRMAGYWFQSQLYANGAKDEKQCYFAPTIRGVSMGSYESQGDQITVDENGSPDGFTRNPQQGWLATLGAESHNGLACVMRFDELLFLYTCFPASTMEWQYKSAAIPSGKIWKTDFVIYPLEKLPRVDYASRRLVAAVEPSDAGGTLSVNVALATADIELTDVTVSGEAMYPLKATGATVPFAPQRLLSVKHAPASVRFQAPHDPSDPLVLRFTVTGNANGAPFTESFETWHGGKYGKNWKVDTTPLYPFPTPERHLTFLKPDTIVKTTNATPKALLCKGLYADDYLPAAVFTALRAEVTPSYFSPASTFPATLTYFPASYEDLMSYDIIALINIDAASLGDAGIEMLKDFVTHGGTLIYGGDLCAFGQGNLTGTSLTDLLPVGFLDGANAPAPRYLKPQSVLCGTTPLAGNAVMLYTSNSFTVKSSAQIRATCLQQPVLAEWRVGAGRVIALTGTSLGVAPRGKTLYLRTAAWRDFLTTILSEK